MTEDGSDSARCSEAAKMSLVRANIMKNLIMTNLRLCGWSRKLLNALQIPNCLESSIHFYILVYFLGTVVTYKQVALKCLCEGE